MMTFFQSISGIHFPVSQISSIGVMQKPTDEWGLPHHVVRMDGDGYNDYGVKVSRHEVDRLLNAACPVIKADPGTELVIFNTGKDPADGRASSTPIIAWRIVDDAPEPITIEELWLAADAYTAIKMPGGQILCTDGERFSHILEFENAARGWTLADRAEVTTGEVAP